MMVNLRRPTMTIWQMFMASLWVIEVLCCVCEYVYLQLLHRSGSFGGGGVGSDRVHVPPVESDCKDDDAHGHY